MFTIDSFAIDLRRSVAPENHVWVCSGRGTVAPVAKTVCGASGFFSPPVAAPDTGLSFSFCVNGRAIPDCGSCGKGDVGLLLSGAEWRPDRILRRGIYHFAEAGELVSFTVESELAAFASRAGFAIRIGVRNCGAASITLRLDAIVAPGHPREVPLGPNWNFTPPAPGEEHARPCGDNLWATSGGVRCQLIGDAGGERPLASGERAEWCVGLCFDSAAAPPSPSSLLQETFEAWRRRVAKASEALPGLSTDIPGLGAYYLRCIASGLVCLWENPAFAITPFPATSGIDGGSLCCYPWDSSGYVARFLCSILGNGARDLLRAMLASHMERHICMALNGEGEGSCSYSYSLWSAINLYWAIATHLGGGGELFEDVLRVFMTDERRLADHGVLKDYGEQCNLLEMRTRGYEHVVPSPNAERAWGFDRLADLASHFGRQGAAEWHAKAAAIRDAIGKCLWDEEASFFRCLHPGGVSETVYSIQAFDALRYGACTPRMKAALVAHVRDGAFLGRYGVSSVSVEDALHYELNDPDWSGGGAYSGEGPQLAETLWGCGESDRAWDVLSRHFWMGEMLPYIPQEHYCDRPATPPHKRANIIAGAAGYEAIVYGMAGFRPQLDGSLRIAPAPPPRGFVELAGIRHRGHRIDLRFSKDTMRVVVNGTPAYEGPVHEVFVERGLSI